MKVSVCIPVYNSERYLPRCLESIAAQTLTDLEVIVVSDCSRGRDQRGWSCKKICAKFKKQSGINLTYIEQYKNKGSMEARREAVYASCGEYILCVDADDALESTALETLVGLADKTGSDIVHCGAKVVFSSGNAELQSRVSKRDFEGTHRASNLIHEGELSGPQAFDCMVTHGGINTFIWAKLIRRDLFIRAWERIPPMFGVWGEDYLMAFYVAYLSKKYVGIRDELYIYSIDTGISSTEKITDLKKWERFCSVSSVFSSLVLAQEEGTISLTPEQSMAINRKCDEMIMTLIVFLNSFVDEGIRDSARQMLDDYCGSEYIEKLSLLLAEHKDTQDNEDKSR